MNKKINSLFDLGLINILPKAKAALPSSEVATALKRHQQGDWSGVSAGDALLNTISVIGELSIWTSHVSSTGLKFFVTTRSDRLSTTVFLLVEV